MIKSICYIAIGGAFGSVLRYLSALFISKYWNNNFPVSTLIINVLGCFLIGFLMSFFGNNYLQNQNLKLLLITGFCGGFTTFSTFGLENINLFQTQNFFLSFLYIGLSIFLGLFAVWIGLFIGK